MAVTGCAGGLAGVGFTADFAVGLAFLNARRTGAFLAGFFLTVEVFLRVAALTGLCFRFALAFAFGFLSCRHLQPPIGFAEGNKRSYQPSL